MSKNMHRVFLFFGMYDHPARTYTQNETVDEDDHDRRHVCLLCSAVAPPAAFTAGLLTPRHRDVLSATSRGLGRIRNRPPGSAWRARSSRDEGYHPRRARPAGRQSPALGPSWSDLDQTEGIRSICGARLARCLQRLAAGDSLAALDSSIWPKGGVLPPSPDRTARFSVPPGPILTGPRAFDPSMGPISRAIRRVLPPGPR